MRERERKRERERERLRASEPQLPFDLSEGSPCHPCRTTFYFSYRFFSLKLPPQPCAEIVVIPTVERMKPDETPPTPRIKYNHVMYGDKFVNMCEMMKPDPNRHVYNRVVFVRPKWYLTHIFTHTYIYTHTHIFLHIHTYQRNIISIFV